VHAVMVVVVRCGRGCGYAFTFSSMIEFSFSNSRIVSLRSEVGSIMRLVRVGV